MRDVVTSCVKVNRQCFIKCASLKKYFGPQTDWSCLYNRRATPTCSFAERNFWKSGKQFSVGFLLGYFHHWICVHKVVSEFQPPIFQWRSAVYRRMVIGILYQFSVRIIRKSRKSRKMCQSKEGGRRTQVSTHRMQINFTVLIFARPSKVVNMKKNNHRDLWHLL